ESAQKVISETGCDAIKIEVLRDLVPTVKFLVENKINVMGHVGLLPQHVREIGGYRYQGCDENSANEILETAKLVEEAGAFSLVIEAVPAALATAITHKIKIPTIGIGASAECDGQVLVIDDLLGLNQEFKPRFVTRYENLAAKISAAVARFRADVKSGEFPKKENLLVK
ncbi:MAG: 3-methyl-2-oxobutanoate hydroxymethyltransferase, partial [Alphaproteobacteria bacterium]|nr:3-methyl-2-oxobutanoate hydroxymethyltransferase [Alphaproteobacteria bacterium]